MTTASKLRPGLRTVPEIPSPIPLPLTGTLPSYLHNSTLYRNGPGRYEATHADGQALNLRHWFDGFALVHAFRIDAENQTVTYRNKFISAGAIRAAESVSKDKYVAFHFGRSDPCRTVLGKFFQMFRKGTLDPQTGKGASNCAVTLQTIPGKGDIVARTDATYNCVLDADTLEVDHFFNFSSLSKELAGPFSAAHGHYDESTGEFINYNFDVAGPGKKTYKVFTVDKMRETKMLATFDEFPSYLHSFATTERYVVMCVWPCRIDGLKVLFNRSVLDGITFEHVPTVFYVISREERKVVAKYQSGPFFCFHTVNAFERDDAIHIDLSKYEDSTILDKLTVEALSNGAQIPPSNLTRFSLENLSQAIAAGPKKIHDATERVINDRSLELPRIHPNLMRKEYRYAYGTTEEGDDYAFNAVAKVDVVTGERVIWQVKNAVVGEPIFVNDPDGVEEDDGVVLVVVLDSVKEKSEMVVLDAKTMTEVATATVPQPVPLGFHGKYAQS